MTEPALNRIGFMVNAVLGVDNAIRTAEHLEEMGYGAGWLTNGGPEDCMPILAAIAMRTSRLRIGSSVVQTYPRHPFVLATEANVIEQLAPGRVRIGIGPSHAFTMEELGIRRVAPFTHLAEYLQIMRLLAAGGQVDFSGEYLEAHTTVGRAFNVPILIGTLQPKTFELAGRQADGAITWLCPAEYIAAQGLPALERGAVAAGRPRPPLIAHLAVCLHADGDEVRATVRRSIPNIRFPAYQEMLARAGLDAALGGVWTDDLVDRVIAWGSLDDVRSRILEMFDAGADEVLIRPVTLAGTNHDGVQETISQIAAAF